MFDVPRARIYEFFVDSARLAKWWGPRGFSIPSVDLAPSVGATYRIEMQPPEGDAFQLTGRFRDVNAPSHLALSFNWEPADPDDVETVAELSFQAPDGSTDVALSQHVQDRGAPGASPPGWEESFEKLDELVSAQR